MFTTKGRIYKLIKSNCKVTTNQNTEYNRANISNGRDSICLVCPIDSILFCNTFQYQCIQVKSKNNSIGLEVFVLKNIIHILQAKSENKCYFCVIFPCFVSLPLSKSIKYGLIRCVQAHVYLNEIKNCFICIRCFTFKCCSNYKDVSLRST